MPKTITTEYYHAIKKYNHEIQSCKLVPQARYNIMQARYNKLCTMHEQQQSENATTEKMQLQKSVTPLGLALRE
jgi:hypothetical protein